MPSVIAPSTGLSSAQQAAGATGPVAAAAAPTYAEVLPDGSLRAPSTDGAYFPSKLRAGKYGTRICSWGNPTFVGTGAVVTGAANLPTRSDNATQSVQISYDVASSGATRSYAQQDGVDGMPSPGGAYWPGNGTVGSNVGAWIRNPGTRSLNFKLTIFDQGGTASVFWTGACKPGGFIFLTFPPSASQRGKASGWTDGTHNFRIIRFEQINSSAESAWQAGDSLICSNVYADCWTIPRCALALDDAYGNVVDPISAPLQSGANAYIASGIAGTGVYTFHAAHGLAIGVPFVLPNTPPVNSGLTKGQKVWTATVPLTTTATFCSDEALTTPIVPAADFSGGTVTSGAWHGTVTERSSQQLVESYGFRGNIFAVGSWIGTTGQWGYANTYTFLTAAQLLTLLAGGWSVCAHSHTHPSNLTNAGLRLLGPAGYFWSNPLDNLPAAYRTNWADCQARRRATSVAASGNAIVTFEAAHSLIDNQAFAFRLTAPPPYQVGVPYYATITSLGSTTTAALSTQPGAGRAGSIVQSVGAQAGTWEWMYPGAAQDESAILADIVLGANTLGAAGIPNPFRTFAPPQGGEDEWVRKAIIAAGFEQVRGISGVGASEVHTVPLGPSTGSAGGLAYPNDGHMTYLDAVQWDSTNTGPQIDTYLANISAMGACGCIFGHSLTATNAAVFDRRLAKLRAMVDAKQIIVQTYDEMYRDLHA